MSARENRGKGKEGQNREERREKRVLSIGEKERQRGQVLYDFNYQATIRLNLFVVTLSFFFPNLRFFHEPNPLCCLCDGPFRFCSFLLFVLFWSWRS